MVGTTLFTSGTFGIVGTTNITGAVGLVGTAILTGSFVLGSLASGYLIASATGLISTSTPVTLPAGATDNTAVRFDGTTGTSLQTSILIISDASAALSRVGGGGIPIEAINTAGAAAAGLVGETMSAILGFGSRATMSDAVALTIVTASMPPGDWNITGQIKYQGTNTCVMSYCQASISNTTNTLDQSIDDLYVYGSPLGTAATNISVIIADVRKRYAATTDVFLVGIASFTQGTARAWGILTATRLR